MSRRPTRRDQSAEASEAAPVIERGGKWPVSSGDTPHGNPPIDLPESLPEEPAPADE